MTPSLACELPIQDQVLDRPDGRCTRPPVHHAAVPNTLTTDLTSELPVMVNTDILRLPAVPHSQGYLLGSWHSGSPAYDALLLTSLPSPQQILSAGKDGQVVLSNFAIV
jgi:hypothetical protein